MSWFNLIKSFLKGTMPRDFRLQVSFMNTFSPNPLSMEFFWKFSEKFAAQGAPVSLTQLANGKNLQSEKFQIFCLFIIATGVNDTSNTGGKFIARYYWYWWQIWNKCSWHWRCTLTCEYLHEFSKKLKWPLCYFQGLGGEDDSWN